MLKFKKLYAMALLSIFLCSCGAPEPIASSKAIMNTEKAIEIGDNYIKGDLSSHDAETQLDDILSNMKYAKEYSFEEKQADATKNADYYLQFYISLFKTSLSADGIISDADTFDHVIEHLDNLKDIYDQYN